MATKSILKKSTTAVSTETAKTKEQERHLATALHHAHLLQQQKDLQKLIYENALELIELPSSPDADPADPTHEDAEKFKRLISIFQPSDYDELLEERNACKTCAYVLCPRPRPKPQHEGKFKLVYSKDHLTIAENTGKDLFCSDACARRALYVKIQLSDDSRAERQLSGGKIDLMKEPEKWPNASSLPFRPKKGAVHPKEGIEGAMGNLSITEDEKYSEPESRLMSKVVIEKQVKTAPLEPVEGQDEEFTVVESASSAEQTAVNMAKSEDEELDWSWIPRQEEKK
jgi:RNA polymerase II-associated protein 2